MNKKLDGVIIIFWKKEKIKKEYFGYTFEKVNKSFAVTLIYNEFQNEITDFINKYNDESELIKSEKMPHPYGDYMEQKFFKDGSWLTILAGSDTHLFVKAKLGSFTRYKMKINNTVKKIFELANAEQEEILNKILEK